MKKQKTTTTKMLKLFMNTRAVSFFKFSETSFLEKEIVSLETKDFFLHILLIFVFPLFSV